eukprot:jgi/Chlat1/5952/Chrsp4S09097
MIELPRVQAEAEALGKQADDIRVDLQIKLTTRLRHSSELNVARNHLANLYQQLSRNAYKLSIHCSETNSGMSLLFNSGANTLSLFKENLKRKNLQGSAQSMNLLINYTRVVLNTLEQARAKSVDLKEVATEVQQQLYHVRSLTKIAAEDMQDKGNAMSAKSDAFLYYIVCKLFGFWCWEDNIMDAVEYAEDFQGEITLLEETMKNNTDIYNALNVAEIELITLRANVEDINDRIVMLRQELNSDEAHLSKGDWDIIMNAVEHAAGEFRSLQTGVKERRMMLKERKVEL